MSENLSSVKNIVNPFGKFFRNLLLGLIFVIVGFGGSFVGANLLDKPQEVDAAGTYYSYTASIEEVNPFISTNGTYLLNKDIKTYFTTAGSVSDKINSLSDDDYYSSETTYAEKYTNIFLSPNIIIKVPNNYNFLGLVGSTKEPTLRVQDNNKTAIQLKSSNVYSSSLNSTSYENGKIYYTNDTLDYGTSIKYWTALVVRKNSFSAVWKQEIFSSKYVNNIGFTSLDEIVKIQFLKISSAPSGYTKVGALSSGVDVYKSNSTVGDIIFGSSSVIDGIGSLDRDHDIGMFSSLSNLKTIKFDNFNTSLMKCMTDMFASSYSLTSLDLSGFNTSNVTTMDSMFGNCRSLMRLDLTSFDTSNVTSMDFMFTYCVSLTSLDLSSFSTSNVTTMNYMFQFCRSLKTLDLSSFNMSSVTYVDTYTMLDFGTEANMVRLTMPRNYSSALNVTSGHNLYYKGQKVVTAGVASTVGTSYSGKTLTAVSFDTNWRTEILNLSGIGITNVNQIYSIKFSSTVPNSSWKKFGTLSSGVDVYKSNSLAMQSNQIIFYSPETIYLINGYMLFEGLTGLTSISFDNFDTSYNYLVHNMFYNCTSLTRLDLSSFDMSSAYWNAEISDDTTLNMLNFGTNAKIKSLTLPSDFGGNEDGTTTNLEDKYIYITNGIDLYYNGTKVVTAGVECQVTGQYAGKTLTSMAMFEFSWREEIINISNIGFSSINDIVKIQFLKTSDVPSGYTKAGMLKSGIEVYKSSTTVGDIIFCSSDTIYAGDPPGTIGLFQQLNNLSEINFSNFNTSKVTDMQSMFSECKFLTNLDLSSFNTSKVTDMECMFTGCENLINIDLSSFDTTKVLDMSSMFSYCNSLTTLDVSSFNTTNVTKMYAMFAGCTSLTSLDLSNFNMSSVTSYDYMLELDDPFLGKKSNIQLLKTPKNAPAELTIGCNTTGSRLYNTATNTAVTSVPANSSTSLTYKRGALLTLTAGSGETINAQTGWTISSDKRTATKIIYYDSTIGSMPTATKTGYKFIGWLKSGSTKYAASDVISSDASGSAVFENTQSTLKIDANGGKYKGAISDTQTKNSGDTIIIRKSYFTKTGYYFGGFTKSSPFYGSLVDNGTTFTYTFGTTAGITDTLTAKWVDAYTITYAKGDATTSSSYYLGTETKIPGEPKQLKSPHYSSFEKKVSNTENYYINGWATSVGGAKVYDLGGYYTNDANITLYPSWGRYNNITYRDSNNNLLGYDYVVNDFWAKNDEYGLSVEGKFLIGWSRTNGSSTAEYLIDNNYNYVSGLTLYPVFEEGYTITYHINGYSTEGTALDPEVVRVGKGVTLKNSDAMLIAPQLYLNRNGELVIDVKNDNGYSSAYRIADYYFIGWTTIATPENIFNLEDLSSIDPGYTYTNSEINIEAPNSERFNKVEYYPGEYIVPTGNIELYPVFRNIAIGYLDKGLDYISGLDSSLDTSSVKHISFVRTDAWGGLPSTVYYNDANGNKLPQGTSGATPLGTIALTGTGANVIPWPDSNNVTHYERVDSNDWYDLPNYDPTLSIYPYDGYRNYTLRAYLIGDNHLVYAFDGDLYGYSTTGEFNFGFLRDTFYNLESFYFENVYFGIPYEVDTTIGEYERGLLNTWIDSYYMPSLTKADLLQQSNNQAVDGSSLFQGYTGLKSVYFPVISGKTISWDLSSFSNTGSMFSGCTNLLNIDGSNKVLFNLSGSGSTDNMFSGCSSLTSIDLSTVDSTKLADMSCMFDGCINLIEVKLTDFDTSKIQYMSNLFHNCSKLTSLDLRSFIIFSGCDVTDIFSGCSSLAKIVTPKSLGKTLQLPSNYKYYNVNDKVKVGNSFNTATTKTLKPYYDIIFNVDGGSSLETLTYLYDIDSTGSQTVNLPSATKTNLTFTGYTFTTNSSPASGLSNLVLTVPKNAKGDITLKANYGSKITFYATSDTAYSTNTYTIDANYSLPTTPTKSGYTFLGWTRDKNGTEPEWTSGQQKADENTSWYAVWRKSDGTHTETGETLTHIFYKTSDSDFDSVTTTTTLNYINDVMNYNYNISKSKKISNGTVSSTTYGSLAYKTLSTTNGYTFVGWNSSSDVSSSANWTSGAKNPTTNTSWYALWKKTENYNRDGGVLTHTFYNTSDSDKTTVTTKITQSITNGTVYYNYNKSKTIQTGGTVSSTTYQQLGFETPTRTNYTFLGWTSTKTDTTASWTEGSKQVSADTSWYAVWQRANGTHTETATLTHTFYKTSDTNTETATTTRTDSYSGDLMAYNYNLSQSRRIRNGTKTSTYSPQEFKTLSTTNGYTFVGWTETKSATSASWIEGVQKFSTNTSWYAVWQKTKNYSKTSTLSHIFVFGSGESDYEIVESTLTTNYTNGTFNYPYTQTGDGELVTNGTVGTKTGSSITNPPATKTGYNLGGWNTDGSYTKTWTIGTTQSPTSDTTYYAVWTKTTTHTFYYSASGHGTAPASTSGSQTQSYSYDLTKVDNQTLSIIVKTRPAISVSGYTQSSWNTKSDGTGTSYALNTEYTMSSGGNTTLYAIWTLNNINYKVQITMNATTKPTITVTANGTSKTASSGTTLTFSIPYGTTFTPSATITSNGKKYNLVWGTNTVTKTNVTTVSGSQVTLTSATTHTLKLTQLYTITAYKFGSTVTNLPSGWTNGTTTITKVLLHDETLGTLPTVAKEGYTFNGWTDVEPSTSAQSLAPSGELMLGPVLRATTGKAFDIVMGWINKNAPNYSQIWENHLRSIDLTQEDADKAVSYLADYKTTINKDSSAVSKANDTLAENLASLGTFGYSKDASGIVKAGLVPSGSTSMFDEPKADLTTTKNEDKNIYADFTIHSSTLTVNPNEGTWSGSTSTQNFTQNYNTTKTIIDPTRTGYTFAGWTLSSGANGTFSSGVYTFGPQNGATDTLTANWTSKADNGVVVSAKTLTYTGSAQELVSVTNPNSLTIYYSLTSLADAQSTKSTTIPKGTNVGDYRVYWYAVETATYKSSSGNVLVTINKAGNTPTVNMSGYIYGGTKSTPTLSNNKSTGSIIYFYSTTNSNSNGTNWAEVLTSTQLNAGTYYMYATISGDTNYNAYTTSTVSFTISKAKVTISAKGNYATTASTKSYVEKTFDNSTTATVKKDTHYTVTSTGNVPTPQVVAKYSNSNVGTWEITITASLTDTTNFEFTSGGNTCKVNGKINAKNLTGTITIKDIPKPTYGNTLETTNTISGSFSYMWYWSANGTTWTECSANNTDSTFMITSSRVGTDVVVGKYLMVVATGTGNYAGSIESAKSGEVVKLDSDIVLTHDTITKVYDGTTSVKQTITAKLKGLDVVTGDVGGAVLTVKSSVYNNATVGTGKTVTVTVEGSGANIGNYSFNSTKTTTGAITKATGTINAISDVTIDYPKETTKTVTITSTGDGALSVSSSATGVATVSLSGKMITITAKSVGSSTITVTLGDGTNYTGASKTFKVTVKGSTYTVTLNTNGGTIASGNVTSYTYGIGATLPTNVTKTGHTFAGWFNNSSLTGTKVTSISSTDTGNKEYWAKWTVNTYRIIYYIHNGTTFVEQTGLLPEAYTYGEKVKLAQPENYGYRLDGWYLLSDEGKTNPLTETPSNAVGPLALYAWWEPVKVTITLNGDGATSTNHTTSVTATYGEAMPQISVLPTRTGYSFDGYYTEKNGAGTQYYTSSGASARNWNSEDSKILYAKWTVNNIEYTVQITMNATTKPNVIVTANGTSNTSYNGEKLTFSIPYGTTFTPTATIESNGKKYNLVWGTNTVTNTNVTTVSGSQVTLTSDTTQKITVTQLYTITAYKYGGTVSGTLSGWTETTDTLVKVLKYNETLGTLPTLTKTGYTFNGWTDVEPSASAQSLAPSGELMLGPVLRTAEANVIIMNWINKNAPNYSQIWENYLSSIDMIMADADKAVSYLVDYKTTINKDPSTVSEANGTLAKNLASLDTFGFKNADEIVNAGLVPSGSTSMFDKDLTTTKNEDKNIYADFTINSSTLTVNPNEGTWSGSTSTQNFTQNYNTTKTIVDPTRTGYIFAGWTLSSGANGTFSNGVYTFGPQNGVTDTLTANWTSKADNGVVVNAKTLTYTGSAQELVTVTNPHSVTIYYSLTSLADAQSTKSTTIPKGTNVGDYRVYWYAVETATYKSSSGNVLVTINKAGNTPTVNMSGYIYGGTKSTPTLSNNKSTGSIIYFYSTTNSNSNGTNWAEVLTSTQLNAGTYYMYATISGDTNYNAYTTSTVSFTISKAKVTISAKGNYATTASTKSYVEKTFDNSTTATVKKDTHYTVTSTGNVPTPQVVAKYSNSNVGTWEITITASLTDTTNFEFTSGGNTCKVNGKINAKNLTGTITIKDIPKPTYGNTLETTNTISGSFSYMWYWSANGTTWTECSANNTDSTFMITSSRVGTDVVVGKYLMVVATGTGNYAGSIESAKSGEVVKLDSDIVLTHDTITKVYDGTTSVKQTITAKLKGLDVVTGDVGGAVLTVKSSVYNNATVGTGKTVTVTVEGSGANIGNYSFNSTKTTTGAITKATGTINAISDVTIDYPKETTKTVTITSTGDGALSVSSSATGVATVSLSGKMITITAKSVGSSTITVTLGDGTNYLGTAIQFTVEVNASTYTVTISVNDANLGSVSKTKVENVPYETAITISGNKLTILDQTITASVIDKTGYTTTFTGFDKTTGTKVTGNMTITANFTRTANKYIVTFNADGGEISESTKEVTFGEAYGQLPVPTKSGYNFDGWYKESGFTTKVDDTTIVSDAKNHTLYAKWTINMEQVVARINNNYYFSLKEAIESVNSGTVIIYLLKSNTENWSEAIKINSGVAINLVSQKSSEVQFEIGTGRIELNGGTLTLGKNSSTTYETVEGDLNDFALVGSGTVIKVVSGTLNVFGGKLQSSTTDVELAGGTMNIDLGPSFTKGILLSDAGTLNIHKDFVSTVPVRLNDDMYTAGNVVVNFDSYESAMTINGRVDIKLKDNTFTLFVENNQMKLAGKILVTYNGNGGKMPDDSETFVQTIYYPEGARTISNPFVRSGYTFAGFDTNKDASEGSIKIGDTINFSADTTLYAIWEKDKTEITITYKVAVISSSKDTNVSYQEFGTEVVDIRKEVTLKTYTQLTSTDYSKYIFFGWFENEPEGILTDNQGLTSIKTSTKDITLYGKLIKKNIRNIEGYNDSQFTLSVTVEGLDANQIYGVIKITYFDEQLGQNRTFTTALKGGETHITGLKYARYTLEFETTFKVEEMNDVVVDTRQEKNSTVNLVISKNNKSGYYYIGSI